MMAVQINLKHSVSTKYASDNLMVLVMVLVETDIEIALIQEP